MLLRSSRTAFKDEILTRYLNTVYFGQGAYGVQAAARTFFDRRPSWTARSALLAGLITSPGHFDPYEYPRRALGRRGVVLRLMEELMISGDQRRAVHQPTPSHGGAGPLPLPLLRRLPQGVVPLQPRVR